jgi:hypothetical protein
VKRFQYLIVDSSGLQQEIWVCEQCRKQNCENILTGRWRLVDKSETADFDCRRCLGKGETIKVTAEQR